jgi:hypothetical protein
VTENDWEDRVVKRQNPPLKGLDQKAVDVI